MRFIKPFIVLFVILTIGCSSQLDNDFFIGKWKIASLTDLKTDKVESVNSNQEMSNSEFVVTADKIIINSLNEHFDSYNWSIENNKLNLYQDNKIVQSVFITSRNKNTVSAEFVTFLGDSVRLDLEKVPSE